MGDFWNQLVFMQYFKSFVNLSLCFFCRNVSSSSKVYKPILEVKTLLMLSGGNLKHVCAQYGFQTSQELRMLSRSDCESLTLNVMIQVLLVSNSQLCH